MHVPASNSGKAPTEWWSQGSAVFSPDRRCGPPLWPIMVSVKPSALMRPLSPILAAFILLAAATPFSAQGRCPAPPMTLLTSSRSAPKTTIRACGDARLRASDHARRRHSMRGLIADDYEIFENGVPQVVRSFIPSRPSRICVCPIPCSNEAIHQRLRHRCRRPTTTRPRRVCSH